MLKVISQDPPSNSATPLLISSHVWVVLFVLFKRPHLPEPGWSRCNVSTFSPCSQSVSPDGSGRPSNHGISDKGLRRWWVTRHFFHSGHFVWIFLCFRSPGSWSSGGPSWCLRAVLSGSLHDIIADDPGPAALQAAWQWPRLVKFRLNKECT